LTEDAPKNEVDIDITKPGKLEFFATLDEAQTLTGKPGPTVEK